MNSHRWHKLIHRGKIILVWVVLVHMVWLVVDLFVGFSFTVTRIVETLNVAAIYGCMVLGVKHVYGQLCEDCMSEVPLNGSLQAEKWEWHLRTVHFFIGTVPNRRRALTRLILLAAVVLAAYFVTAYFIGSNVAGALFNALTVWWLWSQLRHDRVQPWCKRCGWDDGGGGRIEMPTSPPGTRVPA